MRITTRSSSEGSAGGPNPVDPARDVYREHERERLAEQATAAQPAAEFGAAALLRGTDTRKLRV